jgi:hypothetical protein
MGAFNNMGSNIAADAIWTRNPDVRRQFSMSTD